MERGNSDIDGVINLVNRNALNAQSRRMENDEYYDRAWNNSDKDTTVTHEYGHNRKKKRNSEFKRAIVTLLVVTNVLSAGIATIATKVVTNNNNVVINISKDEENRDAITYSPGYSKTINKDIKYSDINIKCTLENNYLIIKINFEDIFTTTNNRDIEIVLYNSTK